ncbi:MAG: hypothetical protein DDT29_00486 [Dehalococcoidia bacterium]|nr:hypothetical protein [Bacillota bacterium]
MLERIQYSEIGYRASRGQDVVAVKKGATVAFVQILKYEPVLVPVLRTRSLTK